MSDNQSNNKRLAKNSIFMAIRMVVVMLITLYTTRVILNVLGVEDYGVYHVVAGFVSMFAFFNNAMSSAAQRFYNFELGKNGVQGAHIVYNASIIIHLILAIVIVAFTEPIGLWYLHNKMVLPESRIFAAEWIFHFSVISMFINIMTTPFRAAIMAHEKMDFYAYIGILDAVLKLVLAVILPLFTGDKLIMYGVFFLLITLINFLLYSIYSKRKFEEIKFGAKVPNSMFKDMLTFSGWNVFGSIAYMLREQGVNLVLNAFFGTVVNAAKGVANQVNGALQGFMSSIVTPARPQVIQSYAQGNYERTWHLTYSISTLAFLFFLMMSLPICLEVKYILHLWLGESVPPHTTAVIIIMLITNTYGSLVAPISTVMHATGKMKFYQTVSSLSNLMSVPLAYIFLVWDDVPEYVFIALLITMFTNLLAGLVSARKYADLSILNYFKFVFLPCTMVVVISLPIGLLPHFFLSDGLVRFLFECVYCCIVVATCTYLIALNNSEKLMIKKVIDKICNRH